MTHDFLLLSGQHDDSFNIAMFVIFCRLDGIQTATEERIAKLQSALSASSSINNLSDSSDDVSIYIYIGI